ncbi:MucBP domain-containing protein [Levilactobacillus acidifarinae]|uniref:Gram-positive cocci surface proteins LPxTG domain-containing protein n=1 Tax=Levilactobacillus acidifarinae DSM 19394 = JCM 15949 TaxID=1423715 RepID=A0A0R1LKV2_9LACO|nr:MucBP domain-containing protein [Levilactobacillus acidifarinae]KRK96256.1 hypothetical protein FD25_GL002725 [Levilactobacillus acidifarinae DSM 19394]GEO70648.1 hypothetical protein LAC03_25580 [Levilactobacillus acidifarinae]
MTQTTLRATRRWWSQSLTVASLTAVCLTGGSLTAIAKTTTAAAATTTAVKSKADETIDSWMPNERLQEAVLKALKDDNPDKNWQSASEVTKDDMQLLKSLHDTKNVYIDGKTDYSLEGLQYATNLERLTLGGDLNTQPIRLNADITDVTPLKDLQKLKALNLQYNRLKDVSPLAGLKNVTQMSLGWNHIEDFSVLPISQYDQFTYTDQFIERPTVNINEQTRSAHLKVALKFKTSTPVELEAPNGYARLTDWTPNDQIFRSYYFNGGTGTPDGQGGLKFTDIVNQEPGPTELPGQNVTPLPDKFYLLGQDKDKVFKVAQPYKLAAAAKSVTAKYQDQDGKSLHDDVVLEGVVGDSYTTEQLTIPGYTFKEVQGKPQGEFSDQSQTVTYVYTKDPVAGQPITVSYVSTTGETIAEDVTLTGQVGDPYEAERLAIAGYEWTSAEGDEKGTFSDQAHKVTMIYTPIEGDGGNGDGSGAEGNGDGSESSSSSNSDSSSSSEPSSSSSSSSDSSSSSSSSSDSSSSSSSDSSSSSSSDSSSSSSSNSSSSSSSSSSSEPSSSSSSSQSIPAVTDEQDDDITGGPGTIGPAGPFEGGLDSDQPGGSSTPGSQPWGEDLTPTVFPSQGAPVVDGDLPQTNEHPGRIGVWIGAALLVTMALSGFSRRTRQNK